MGLGLRLKLSIGEQGSAVWEKGFDLDIFKLVSDVGRRLDFGQVSELLW